MNVIALALAIAALLLMLAGALFMASSEFGIAGALFLSASIVIYIREKRV